VVTGVFFSTTSRSSSVDVSASSPSRPRLDPAACTGRIKGQGGEMARTSAHGRRGRVSVYARWWDRVRTFGSFTALIGARAGFIDERAAIVACCRRGAGCSRRGARGCACASAAARAPCGNSGGVSAVSSMRQVARALPCPCSS
jgi:hypothetical protein